MYFQIGGEPHMEQNGKQVSTDYYLQKRGNKMSLTSIFQEKTFEIFAFVKNEYGFEFELINDHFIIARKQDMNLHFIFDRGVIFSVEIEVTGALGERAIQNPNYRVLGTSTMAECIDSGYKLKVKKIRNESDLLSEIQEEARVLRKYCDKILAGDVSDWKRIVDCLLKG